MCVCVCVCLRAHEWGTGCGNPGSRLSQWHLCLSCHLGQKPGCHPQFLSLTFHSKASANALGCPFVMHPASITVHLYHHLPGLWRSLLPGLPASTSAPHCPFSTGSWEDPVGSSVRSRHWPVVPCMLRIKHQLLSTAWPQPRLTSFPSSPLAHPAAATLASRCASTRCCQAHP